jgi:hypothetical protein
MALSKMIFRSTRGKAYVHFFDLNLLPEDSQIVGSFDHVVFIVVFEEGHFMREKVKRICNSFCDNFFEIQRNTVASQVVDYEQ